MKLPMTIPGKIKLLKLTFVCVLMLTAARTHGQERKLEISLKGSYLMLSGDDAPVMSRDVQLAGVGLESVYFANRYVGIGAFFYEYPAIASYTSGLSNTYNIEFDTHGRSFGMSLQLTSNKNRIFRVYANGKFSYLQLRDESGSGDFTIYNKGHVISAGVGVMLKISRGVNFNLFEASYLMPSKELSYSDKVSLKGFTVSTGFTFKMIRAK